MKIDLNVIFFHFHPCSCPFARVFHSVVYFSAKKKDLFFWEEKGKKGFSFLGGSILISRIGQSLVPSAFGKMSASICGHYWSFFFLFQLGVYWSLKQS